MRRYHPLLVALHWVLAVMIIMALFAGSTMLEPMPNSNPEKLGGLQAHMTIGLIIGGLLLLRLITRFTTRKPPHADTGNALLNRGGHAAHWLLYLLALIMVASGIGTALSHDLFAIVFQGSGAPLPESFAHEGPRLAHGLFAKLLMLLILLHILGWAYHQFILKDGLFSRMWFGKR